ncbi:hypothetical protein BGW36DRAFT_353887 [Talaromyces proteolyticus]|uniref:Mid2 domain-containing protein n=1 Tax=Talaromyces proteolyticus TaxID=1131652 RepID=A0AAD4L5I7_9EURO|nr:uncharacterized protein BGW36DRAFT_353887 [Talaromyces proteolyticus]KAH8705481.1 hypothetical protein BGW36DRAFT_353887 [Talaromyces proteolyticus]
MAPHRSLLTVVTVALMMPIIMGTATQSVEVDILFPGLNEENLHYLEGSVINADTSATTIQIDCRSSVTELCVSSGYVLPQTLTNAPSSQAIYYDITSFFNRTIYIVTGALDCNITSSTEGASCFASTSTWYSSGLKSNSSAWSTGVTISSDNLKYNTLTVASGLEKLRTTTTSALPGQTMAATSSPTAAAATNTSIPSSEHSSSSKAWIAGPVVGGVVGLGLVAAVLFWYISRRHKKTADPAELYPEEEKSEVPGHDANLPVANAHAGELAAKRLSELPDQNRPHEMP